MMREMVLRMRWLVPGLAAVMMAGCVTTGLREGEGGNGEMAMKIEAAHAREPVSVDGQLDEAVWDVAPSYALGLASDRAGDGTVLREPCQVQFAWNEEWFYMAVSLTDSDVVAEGTDHGQHHYTLGDVAELFLWPADHPWYWELYVTPAGKYTSFFFPGPGRLRLPSTFENHAVLDVAACVQGTLNDWSDRDRGWTAEMAVPVAALTQRGEAWGPGTSWRVLVGRYNYSAHLPAVEISCLPKLSRTSFHLRDEYGVLELLPQAGNNRCTK